ncbi:hypothetical protein DS745_11440 [Anaerobacillus alkaliphilus]|uniref:Uncharacterized protein n=1 Tax=Anaerobacillus alkaliphilus TaxID=1548597 RepID=A0A4Q0VT94_9BACI|nr:hypothetical protein DS745_11440 [Anaerobacillus alkaliphilus]
MAINNSAFQKGGVIY